MSKIVIKELKKSFKGEDCVDILDIPFFEFENKGMTALTGTSGSGKSTLLQIVAGLESPTSGEVIISCSDLFDEPVDINKIKERDKNLLRRNEFGFIYQRNFLIKDLNVIDNLLLATNNKEKAVDLLEKVGLTGKSKRYYSELSGGERQRVAICRALMNDPSFVFADEPTGSLDDNTSNKIWDLFLKIREDHQFGLIMVTHDQQLASLCDNVYQIKEKSLIKVD